jgi:protein-disulfide isomerase
VCAGKQGKYGEMSDKLFAAQADVKAASDPVPLLKGYAKDLGLDTAIFDKCLDEGEVAMDVASDGVAAQTFGVSATPAFFANDVQIYLVSTDALFYQIDYVSEFGSLPDIEPQAGDFHAKYTGSAIQAAMAVFLDFTSTDAAKYAIEVYPQIAQQYIDTGTLLYIFHPWAAEKGSLSYQAAVAAECAGEQDKFWEMQAKLFADQASWTVAKTPRDSFTGYADGLGLDKAKFETCLDGDWAALRAQAGSFVGSLYSVTSAQTYLFGGGSSLSGAPTYDQVKTIIDGVINQ